MFSSLAFVTIFPALCRARRSRRHVTSSPYWHSTNTLSIFYLQNVNEMQHVCTKLKFAHFVILYPPTYPLKVVLPILPTYVYLGTIQTRHYCSSSNHILCMHVVAHYSVNVRFEFE